MCFAFEISGPLRLGYLTHLLGEADRAKPLEGWREEALEPRCSENLSGGPGPLDGVEERQPHRPRNRVPGKHKCHMGFLWKRFQMQRN